ncbi:glutamate-5-semialdehyde dehydrogenase [Miltoncostaea oceani]|uniref:glutamate-5-semialdehyde dehydrogenase n=1 Tax=Miltoncostaea oceani TaxID=2843216 RepID=UPI001C3E7E19|nr:glutamate-5-semialdehyde dehydrogenase [Miltoncostaea oceani]
MNGLRRVVADVRAASRVLARLPGHHRDAVLLEMAEALERRSGEILRDNRLDVEAAKRARTAPALIDRLLLDEDRVADMAAGLRAVAALPDPVGVVDGGRRLPNGLEIVRRRVPLGVVAVIYEGRPNVTADAVGLCLKSGNAVILRGSRLAMRSNQIIAEVLTGALIEADAPRWSVALLGSDRDEMRELVQMEGDVDLVIPRGGEELKAFLREHTRVPVIYAASGNNHVYVHADADPAMAVKIAVNAKVQRPGVCNAAETLLVHRDAAPAVLPLAAERLMGSGVELRVDRAGLDLLGDAAGGLAEATEADYATEFLDLVLAVRVVASLEEAVDHIARFGSGHSEAIVTDSLEAAGEFQASVDAAVVYVNASTRFTDGGEFGMGAEIGISTQKLHARGPIGLSELTSYTYLVTGHGHLR